MIARPRIKAWMSCVPEIEIKTALENGKTVAIVVQLSNHGTKWPFWHGQCEDQMLA